MFNETTVASIVGIQRFSWTDKNSGEVKKGCNLHCSFSSSDIEGSGATSIFIMQDKFIDERLKLGDKILVMDRGRDGFAYIGSKALFEQLK